MKCNNIIDQCEKELKQKYGFVWRVPLEARAHKKIYCNPYVGCAIGYTGCILNLRNVYWSHSTGSRLSTFV
jgi:hypothetical protein